MFRLPFSFPFTGVSSKHRIVFYTQLEQMLDAGIPPARSLRTISQYLKPRKLRRAVAYMASHIENGGSLTTAFDGYPDIFPPLERRIINAAESGGFSSQAISGLARFQTDMRQLLTQFWMQLIYPGLIIFTAIVVCPLLKAIFLGGVENLLVRLAWNAAQAFGIIVALLLAFRILNSLTPTRIILHRISLNFPFIGKLFRRFAKVRFAKTLASLYAAGLPVREAFRDAALASGNETIARRLLRSMPILNEGGTLSEAISRSGYFDAIALGMIATGEETGKLDSLLNKYANHEEQEAITQLKVVSRAIPMLVYYGVLFYVAYIIIGFYKNYFDQLNKIQ